MINDDAPLDIITESEIRQELGFPNRFATYRAIKRGDLPVFRLNGRIVADRKTLRAYLRRRALAAVGE